VTRHPVASTSGAVAVAYAALGIFIPTVPLLSEFVAVRTTAAVPVVSGVLFGFVGAIGVGIGELVVLLVRDTQPAALLYRALGVVIQAAVVHTLWGNLRGESDGRPVVPRSPADILEYGVTTTVAGLAGAGVVACGAALGGTAPFYVSTLSVVPGTVIAGFALGVPALYLFEGRLDEARLTRPRPRTNRSVQGVAVVSVAWVLAGSAASLVFMTLRYVPAVAVQRRELLCLLFAVFGDDGTVVHAVGCAVGFVLLVHLLFASRYDR